MDVSVVIPVIDDAPFLPQVVEESAASLEALEVSGEIIVADGAANGDLQAIAEEAGALYVSSDERGYGAAALRGIAQAQGDYILTLDPDTDPVKGIIRALWDGRERGDVVVGSRYVPLSRVEQPGFRQFLSKAMNFFFGKLLSTPLNDLSTGIRIHRRDVFQRVNLQTKSLAFLLESHLKWMGNGIHVAEVPIHYHLHEYRAAQAHGRRLGLECLKGCFRLWSMRNSVECADYDLRAYDSRIWLQRYWQRKRHHVVMQFVPRGVSTIDVGCGSGRIIADLDDAVGVDIRFEKLYFMSTIHRKLAQVNGLQLPFPDSTFECVISSEVIEHIPEEDGRFVDELVRILKPGGTLVLGTPDYSSKLWTFIEDLYRRVAPNAYAHEHVTHYTHDSLKKALEDRGCEVLDCGYVCASVMVFKARKRDGSTAA